MNMTKPIPAKKKKILEKINQLQLQCNVERNIDLIPDSAESGVGPIEANPKPQNTPRRDIASSDEEESI